MVSSGISSVFGSVLDLLRYKSFGTSNEYKMKIFVWITLGVYIALGSLGVVFVVLDVCNAWNNIWLLLFAGSVLVQVLGFESFIAVLKTVLAVSTKIL